MRKFRFLIIFLLSLCQAFAASEVIEKNITKRLEKEIVPIIEKDMARLKVPGLSMAIVSDGKVLWKKGFGYQNREEKLPATPETVYRVGSISKLFIAGFIPGLLIAAGLATVNYFLCRKKGYVGSEESWSVGKIAKAVKEGIWSIMAPVVILGGIYTGFFTPTEAAVVAIFYTLFVGIFIHKELKLGGGSKSLEACTWLTGRVLLIMFTARAFGRLLVQYRIPEIVANGMLAMTSNLYIIWVLVIVFLIFVGMFMETLATIMILTPVLLPVMMKLGVDPIHFGIVFVCCCEIGFETPPLGENLFIASGIGDTSIEDISLKAIPFSLVEISSVFLIAFIPAISLWFPKLLGY